MKKTNRSLTSFRLFLILSLLWLSSAVSAQNVLPQPSHIALKEGTFAINSTTTVYANLRGEAAHRLFNAAKEAFPKLRKAVEKLPKQNAIRLITTDKPRELEEVADNQALQAYTLTIDRTGITVKSPTETGLFYALQTLIGLQKADGTLPYATASDTPRFKWRGFMLDCSRHYFTPDFIKKQIDMMAHFKLNRLHLHMVDGAAWRIETESYPLLTQKTAFRTSSDWNKWWIGGERTYCEKQAPGAYGGFYTKQELKDIVAYAAQRHIVVLPEIEMPGHSEEVTYAYPQLGCTGIPYTCSDLCVGNDSTFVFFQKVLDEILEVFPSRYIHIGGDEAVQDKWKSCPKCQKCMQTEGLKNTHELQSYMIRRIGNYLLGKGRSFIGWDEIMEGGLAPNAAVMSWRGYEAGLTAARAGHHVVMSPVNYCYLDYYQDNPTTEPQAMGGYVPLDKVYEYDPVPDSIKGTATEKFINGIQGNLWTEFVDNPSHAEYMAYPRLLAIAETGWSRNKTAYADFRRRVIAATAYLTQRGFTPYRIEQAAKPREESVTPLAHQALGAKITYITRPSDKYKGTGDGTLTDGRRGTWSYIDGCWQGFCGEGRMELIVDMGQKTALRNISAEFMQFIEPWIHMPSEINIYVSDDNTNYTLLSHTPIAPSAQKYFIKTYEWTGNASARYIKYIATAANKDYWLFTDEIVVNR